MNRWKAIYFIGACLCVLVIVVGISTLSDIVYDHSSSVQYYHTVTKNDTFKENRKNPIFLYHSIAAFNKAILKMGVKFFVNVPYAILLDAIKQGALVQFLGNC